MQTLPQRLRSRAGFTLAEIVIALGLIALVVLAVLGVIGAARRQIERVIAVDQAIRLTPAVQYALDSRRSDNSGAGETEVQRFGRWMNVVQNGTPLIAFSYRAEVPNGDGSMNSGLGIPRAFNPGSPAAWVNARLGRDYIIYDTILTISEFKTFLGDPATRSGAIVGQALVVTLSESPANPSGLAGTTVDNYPEAVVAAEAKFFIPGNYTDAALDNALNGNLKPVHSINIAFNR